MNWSYIAGFFDGEGSLTHNGRGFRITIPNTNEDVINAIHIFTGIGNVIKLRKREIHWKDSWLYYIACKRDVYVFLKKTAPYLIVKKKHALQVIPYLKNELIKMEEKKNVYKKRKIEAKKLRLHGLNYREIGRKLEIDWGYARRLVLDLV